MASDLREQFDALVKMRDGKAKREATAALVLALIAAVETLQEDVAALRKGRGRR